MFRSYGIRRYLLSHLREPKKTPFNIKPEYGLLQRGNHVEETLLLKEKTQVNKDFYIFKFLFQDQNKCLGVKVGDHVNLGTYSKEGKKIFRPYMPVSSIDDMGFVDFLIKNVKGDVNSEQQAGEMSQILVDSTINDKFILSPPDSGIWTYNGYGEFMLRENNQKSCRYIVMFAEDSGLTAFYQ